MEGDLRGVWAECARLAAAGERGALAIVVSVRGSGPQVAGAKLALREDGRFTGTVGGGAVEAAVLRDAARVRDGAAPAGPRRYQLAAELGMCCGGTMEILIAPIASSPQAAIAWSLVARAAREDGGALRLVVSSEDPRVAVGTMVVTTEGGGLAVDRGSPPELAEAGATIEVYTEPLAGVERLVLFGGGHVAKPLAQLALLLGYEVTIVDDRPEWASAERFPDAALVHEPYEDYLHHFVPRATDTLIIVTRGHDFDQAVLASLIDKPSRYLGLIGSRAKVKRAFLRLEAEKVPTALVARVHAPVGLDLGAQTPEEIAVAVAAELVLERRAHPRPAGVPAWWRT